MNDHDSFEAGIQATAASSPNPRGIPFAGVPLAARLDTDTIKQSARKPWQRNVIDGRPEAARRQYDHP